MNSRTAAFDASTTDRRRTVRVVVPGWVIDDGSFPTASVGDEVEVTTTFISHCDPPSPLDEDFSVMARPAYGRMPRQTPGASTRWWHLIDGNGWSSGWWSDRTCSGRVERRGHLRASMGFGSAIDTPCAIRGRVIDIHLLEERIDRSPSGWRTASGSEQLSRIATVPSGFMLAPDDDAQNTATAIISTGVVVDLDIDVVPEVVAPFVAGAIDIIGDTVWVMHRSDPTLLRIDRSVVPPRTTSYLLPLTIESATSMWTRRIHATEAGCWIVGEHDIHWLDGSDADTDAVSIVRVCNDGGRTTALLDGSLYVLAGSTEHLTIDRRHGLTRIPPVPHTVRRLDVRTRALVSVGDDAIRSAANAAVRHPFTATALDGTTWVVDGDIVVRTGIEREADDVYYHDVEHPIIGAVRWVHTSPADDPDTVRMMDSITIRIEPE